MSDFAWNGSNWIRAPAKSMVYDSDDVSNKYHPDHKPTPPTEITFSIRSESWKSFKESELPTEIEWKTPIMFYFPDDKTQRSLSDIMGNVETWKTRSNYYNFLKDFMKNTQINMVNFPSPGKDTVYTLPENRSKKLPIRGGFSSRRTNRRRRSTRTQKRKYRQK